MAGIDRGWDGMPALLFLRGIDFACTPSGEVHQYKPPERLRSTSTDLNPRGHANGITRNVTRGVHVLWLETIWQIWGL